MTGFVNAVGSHACELSFLVFVIGSVVEAVVLASRRPTEKHDKGERDGR